MILYRAAHVHQHRRQGRPSPHVGSYPNPLQCACVAIGLAVGVIAECPAGVLLGALRPLRPLCWPRNLGFYRARLLSCQLQMVFHHWAGPLHDHALPLQHSGKRGSKRGGDRSGSSDWIKAGIAGGRHGLRGARMLSAS